jgi:hypothetical protein
MLTSSVAFLHDNECQHTAAALEKCWNILTGSCLTTLPSSLDLAPSNYNLFTYPKNLLRSQSFNNKELMEGVKTWLSSQMVGER